MAKIMTQNEAIKAVGKQILPEQEHLDNIIAIAHTLEGVEKDLVFACLGAFHYGVIVGIQKERERRRKAAEKQKQTVSIPVLDIPQMSDYKWQLNCLKSRLEHPEIYADSENVEKVIADLCQWLEENKAMATAEELRNAESVLSKLKATI